MAGSRQRAARQRRQKVQRAARAAEAAEAAKRLTRFTPASAFRDGLAVLPVPVSRTKPPKPDGLNELRRLVALQHEIADAIRQEVLQGRARGLSWAVIASALRVTRQAARQRCSAMTGPDMR